MLTSAGDILNWFAAGALFPLMFLPLAALLEPRRSKTLYAPTGATIWFFLVTAATLGGLLFATLAPRLGKSEAPATLFIFSGFLGSLTLAIAIIGGPTRAMHLLARVFAPAVRATGRAVMWLVAVMALVQFSVVILRYVFGLNFIFMQESITYMHGAVFLLAAGYALLTDDQVRVDLLYRTASPRKRALVDFAGTYLFLFPICLLILWTSSAYVGNAWAVQEGSNEQSGIQGVFILKSMIPAFAVLLAMAGFVRAAEAGAVLRGER